MSLTAGSRLGAYEIVAPLGAGGMGEVYRARDTRLKRDVALKVLPEGVAHDPDRLARFQREAEVLAGLSHPHIAALFGLEDITTGSGASRALVMELVEGSTLADRIAAGPIPVPEVLSLAQQLVDAIDHAHGQGVLHRDLKPANIKITPGGTLKVLDFGLAKLASPPENSDSEKHHASQSPTVTSPAMTAAGMILGTAAYMAPEQARGRAVDKRADIWAFGCVLFEMLTGRRAFEGADVSDTLASVLRSDPEWPLVPTTVSPAVVVFLKRCLHKDPAQRLRDIADFRLVLDDGLGAPIEAAPSRPRSRRGLALAWAVAVLALLAAATAYFSRPSATAPKTIQSTIVPPSDAILTA